MVRLGRRHDEPAIYDLLIRLYHDNAMSPIAPRKVQRVIKQATRGQGSLIGIIDGDDGLAGSVGLRPAQWWYSDEWHLEELWVYVPPEHRGRNHERELIEFAKQCADQLGVPLLMGILTQHRVDAKIRLYQRQIPQVGALFLHRS